MRYKILLLCSYLSVSLYGQQSNPYLQLPTVIPPSPVAQNFMRYGEIPVDYSTGVPKIDIPIYTIQGNKLSLPISISYHASGIKVYDVPSEVGLGWVLNAGGIVTRTMMDNMDENGSPTKTYNTAEQFLQAIPNIIYNSYDSSCQCYPGSHTLEMFLDTKYNNEDLMSDRYFYSLPSGVSGVFRNNFPQNNTFITLPYRPFKISRPDSSVFKITDDKGVIYSFQRFNDSSYGNSEWYLKEMKSADGTETITFSYTSQQSQPNGMQLNIMSTPKEFMNGVNCKPGATESGPEDQASGTGTGTSTVVLSSIETDDVLVSFTYSNRQDFQYLQKLDEIKVISKKDNNSVKKKINLNHSYFGSSGYGYEYADKRLKFDSMISYGENNSLPQTYSFSYEQSEMLPPLSSRKFDFWGYYNGTNNGTTIHNDFIGNPYQNSGYGGNRMADNGYFSKACMLQEITYPAGGRTKFEFERAHVDALYSGPLTGGYIGGFRVSRITNYHKDNNISNIKTYTYSDPVYNIFSPDFYTYYQKYIDYYEVPSPVPYTGPDYCWVFYKKRIITSTPIVSYDLAPGLPIAYSSVTEYEGTVSDNVGKTEYHYSAPDHFTYVGELRELHSFQNDWGNYEPKLNYKLVLSSTGQKVSEDLYSYSDHYEQEFQTGINITRTLDYLPKYRNTDLPVYATTPYGQIPPFNTNDYIQSIKAHDTKAFQKADLLDYSIKKTYDHNNENKYVEERVDYSYNQHNLMIKQTSKTSSLGENILTEYKYPYDLGTLSPYNKMLTKNILTPVIEQTTNNNSKQIDKIQTVYNDWGDEIIEPEIIKAQTGVLTTLEDRIRFISYDKKGNVTSLKKESDIPITYLWGYDKTLPIAKVENSNLVSQAGTVDLSKYIYFSIPPVPMGSTVHDLGTFIITEEKNYKVDRTYEQLPNNYSVTYNIEFENLSNNLYSRTFTDSAPAGGNSHLFTSPSVLLKPGTYRVKVTNMGYNGYQGNIEHQFNFIIYNTVNVDNSVPFHTSFEDDLENISTSQSKTGKKSHTGQYNLKIPPASSGYSKVIVSYWKKDESSPWEYVENTVDANGQDYSIPPYNYVDEVRMYPVGSLMTTFTYDPFYKQPTSIMKPNNDCEYYKYDTYGRLIDVRDENGNILKEYEYHFKP